MQKIPIRHLTKAPDELHSNEHFKIRRVEEIALFKDAKNEIQQLHKHDFFFILALQKGSGHHEIDFTSYKIANRSVFFLRPGQAHKLNLEPGSSGFLMEFNANFYHPQDQSAKQRLRNASNKNHCIPDPERFHKLETILSAMADEYSAREANYRDSIRAHLDIFFIEYIRQGAGSKRSPVNTDPYTQRRYEEFLELLDKHISMHKQVSHYTNLMSLSAYQLNDITKSSTGKTASELITEHILLEAKRYLLATPNQVKEIANILGYDDASYFIRFFRKHSNYAPEAFRKKYS